MREFRVNSWQEFIQTSEIFDAATLRPTEPNFAFRGQSSQTWALQPSLLRQLLRLGANETEALELEARASVEFRSIAHNHISTTTFITTPDTLSWWTVMQHHGAPTRLLDWSQSIFVAAYFAVTGCPSEDGAIFCVHINSNKLYNDANFPDVSIPVLYEHDIQRKFLQPGGPEALVFSLRHSMTDRMIAQQGLFSISHNILSDHGQILNHAITLPVLAGFEFAKLIIPADQKNAYLCKLRQMNITANSLFPGMDGLGRSISELLQLGSR